MKWDSRRESDGFEAQNNFGEPVADKKRQDRNMREQQRSYKIAKQIDELKLLLEESGIKVENSKYGILHGVTSYVRQLQVRHYNCYEHFM